MPVTHWTFPFEYYSGMKFSDGGYSEGAVYAPPRSIVLRNTGTPSIAFIVRSSWNQGGSYQPGVSTGEQGEVTGVLSSGQQVELVPPALGGYVALLGSAGRFSSTDGGGPVRDEGSIPWPSGVTGGEGAKEMNVAQVELREACPPTTTQFW